jgi:hypothetical protein
MTSAGPLPLRTYSSGGIANSPQLALFGEGRTPEAFVPVPSGKIPVEMRGLRGGQKQGGANIQIVNNASGLTAIEAREDALSGKILVTVNALVDQKMKSQVPGIVANSQRRAT